MQFLLAGSPTCSPSSPSRRCTSNTHSEHASTKRHQNALHASPCMCQCQGCIGNLHLSQRTRRASHGESRRGSKRSRCTRPRTTPCHHMPTPGVSGASQNILKRLPLLHARLCASSYRDLAAENPQGQARVVHERFLGCNGNTGLVHKTGLAGSVAECNRSAGCSLAA